MKDDNEEILDNALSDENTNDGGSEEEVTTRAVEDGDQSDKQEEADTSTESAKDDESGEDTTDKPKKNGVQKRISELTADKYALKDEVAYWKSLAQEKVDVGEEPKPPLPPNPSLEYEKPEEYQAKLSDYQEKLHKYNKDLLAWNGKQTQADTQSKEYEEYQKKIDQQWTMKAAKFKEEAADFDALVMRPDNPLSQSMADIAKMSDLGPQVLYELAKNPELAARIYHMNPMQTAHEMGKIEARLAVKPKKSSAAPDPVATVSGGGESATMSDDDLPMEEYAKKYWAKMAAQQN